MLARWLWSRYLRRHTGGLAIAMLLMAIEGSMMGVLSYMMRPMFDDIFVGGNQSAVWWVGLAILGIFFVRALSSMGQKIALTRIKSRTGAEIRSDLLRHLMSLSGRFHQTHPPGQLIERVQGDVLAINTVWGTFAQGIGRDAVAVIWLFGVALSVDWAWTLVALIGIPVLVAPSLLVQGYVRRQSRKARDLSARISTRLDEVFHGIDAVKLNRLEDHQVTRFDALSGQRVKAEVHTSIGQSAIPGLIDIMTGVGFLGVLIYGGGEIIAGEKTVGQFMSFFTAMALAFEPLRRLGNLSGQWQTAAASIERIKALFDVPPALTLTATPAAPPKAAPEIRFDDVHLSYGEHKVLRGVTFTARAGATTALVGASGAGKSTLFRLLTRLVDPKSGAISLDGTAISALDPHALRDMISTVAQDAALFDETLHDNIVLGRDVSEPALRAALDAAHVSDFLPRLDGGLDAPAGPRGSALSGGQRQRVAIARAILRDTPVLLLDEATSALDTKSEAVVQQALDGLAQGRTTLVIAHRLSTVQGADSIVVMDRGKVVDQGTHEELLDRPGPYADLYSMQFRHNRERDD